MITAIVCLVILSFVFILGFWRGRCSLNDQLIHSVEKEVSQIKHVFGLATVQTFIKHSRENRWKINDDSRLIVKAVLNDAEERFQELWAMNNK
ncbi:hypothetical protein UFOVP276_2 [uncultured Caudovirales phage]|uniref:Uncharacterized protein n=1 Tax=uncultured Caudovirales phage TaxID=2100421 RepID=A0A6J5LP11_9CAUD|nr:hypothetical protein UFOVP127_139 [uncultured Caudovirales phage]CAB4134727.1 hypothetical protein UFOVP276_2 [uncultured Caudovirales phage]